MAAPGLMSSARILVIGRTLGLLAAFGAFVAIAAAYGTSAETDAFFCAYAVPNAFLIVAGAILPQTFVAAWARIQNLEGEPSARRFAAASFNVTALALVALTAICVLAAPWLAGLAAPGLGSGRLGDVERQLRWLAPVILFGGLANLAKGILNARFIFFTPSLDTFATYALVIVAVALGSGSWGIGALVLGTLLGNVFRIAVMGADLRKAGWMPALSHPGVAAWAAMLGPLAAGAAIFGANFVLMQSLTSLSSDVNAVSTFGYAERLVRVPSELIAATLGAALLPAAAARHVAGDRAELGQVTSKAVRGALLLLIPAAVGIMTLAEPLVRLVYEHGEFSSADSQATAGVLFWLAPVLPGHCFIVVGQAYFAMRRIWPVIAMWCAITVLTTAFGWILLDRMGARGVALSYSLSTLIVGAGGVAALSRASLFPIASAMKSAGRMTVAAVFMGALVAAASEFMRRWEWGGGKLEIAIELVLLAVLGAGIYAGVMRLLGAPEWGEARRHF
jgi:putative peptidoglycan lipid II flippase